MIGEKKNTKTNLEKIKNNNTFNPLKKKDNVKSSNYDKNKKINKNINAHVGGNGNISNFSSKAKKPPAAPKKSNERKNNSEREEKNNFSFSSKGKKPLPAPKNKTKPIHDSYINNRNQDKNINNNKYKEKKDIETTKDSQSCKDNEFTNGDISNKENEKQEKKIKEKEKKTDIKKIFNDDINRYITDYIKNNQMVIKTINENPKDITSIMVNNENTSKENKLTITIISPFNKYGKSGLEINFNNSIESQQEQETTINSNKSFNVDNCKNEKTIDKIYYNNCKYNARNHILNCYCLFHKKLRKNILNKKYNQSSNLNKKEKEIKKIDISKPFLISLGPYKKKQDFTIESNKKIFFKGVRKNNILKQVKGANYNIIINKRKNWEIERNSINLKILADKKKNNNFVINKKNNFTIKKIKKKAPNELAKKKDNIKGLNNFSLNCYMNSLLQCFYHIKDLREGFIDPKQFSKNDQKVCYSLAEVMKGLSSGKEKSFSPKNFKTTLGGINKLFSGRKGADVSDLYRTVVDSIINEIPYEYPEDEDDDDDGDNTNQQKSYENSKKEVDKNNPINKVLNYFYETVYECPKNKGLKCYAMQNDTSIMFELLKISKFLNGQKIDLMKCFDYNFRVVENNGFFCSRCQCPHTNYSQDKLISLPKVLCIILNRGKGKQFVDKIEFSETINIKKYVDETFINRNDRKYDYKLIGVSSHIGSSSDFGHYIAYCFRKTQDSYYCFNDEDAKAISFKDISHDPYILFYEQINDDDE